MKQFWILILITSVTLVSKAQSVVTKRTTGYFNLTELNFHSGEYNADIIDSISKSTLRNEYNPFISSVTKSVTTFGIRSINGCFFSPKLSLGLGIGLERFNGINRTSLPLFIDLRYYLKDAENSFFTYGDVGHSFGTSLSGTMFDLGFGFKFMISQKLALNTSAGYHAQHVANEYQSTWNKRPLIQTLKLSAGVLF